MIRLHRLRLWLALAMAAALVAAIALWMGGALPVSQRSPLAIPSASSGQAPSYIKGSTAAPSASPESSGTVLSSTVQRSRSEGSELEPAQMSPLPTPALETGGAASPAPWPDRPALPWVGLGAALALGIAFTVLRWYARITR